MRTLRFHEYGPALDVLRLEDAETPEPGPGQIRIAVQACGLNPADWGLCGGLFAGELPRGIGLDVAGTVDAIGAGVTGAAIGAPVFGPAPFTGPTAGASEQAVLDVWFPIPGGLDPVEAAALPLTVETAYRCLDRLGVGGVRQADGAARADGAGQSVLINGAGTTVGYAAVQIALQRGARVIAAAGNTYAEALRSLGAEVTPYGEGLADRVLAIAGGPVDLVFDAAPPSNALPALIQTVAAPDHVLTASDFAAAKDLGVRIAFDDGAGDGRAADAIRYDVLGDYARLASEGRFSIPVARTFPLDDWRTAAELSLSGRAGGKLVLKIN